MCVNRYVWLAKVWIEYKKDHWIFLSSIVFWYQCVSTCIYIRQGWLCDKGISDLWQVCGFLRVLRFPPPIKLASRYSWHIVDDINLHISQRWTNIYTTFREITFYYILFYEEFSRLNEVFRGNDIDILLRLNVLWP